MKNNHSPFNFRFYFVISCFFLFAIVLCLKLIYFQLAEGEEYKKIANDKTLKNFKVKPIPGNIYSDDQSLLATSVAKYELRWDSKVVSNLNFEYHKNELAYGISEITKQDFFKVKQKLEEARRINNRYWLVGKNLSYSEQIALKRLPIFNLPAYKGGLIVEQKVSRERPLGKVAERTVGYMRVDDDGKYIRVGLEGAYSNLLEGKEGYRLKRKIANGRWKSINNTNEIEPKEGYDIHTTINLNFQDIAHNSLLEQMEKYEAEYGTVIVMEVSTGAIKAISNLGITSKKTYFEKLNYAVGSIQEPGSTFKLMSMIAALEDGVVNPSDIIHTGDGERTIYGKKVKDSKKGGYGSISVSKVFEVSSNTGIVNIVYDNYKNNPKKFVDRLYNMGLHKILDIPIKGEGVPKIPYPTDKDWSGISLPWMAWGYGVSLTPLQILTFYNSVANNGIMVKPIFIDKIGPLGGSPHIQFSKKIINPSICSKKTLKSVKQMLFNVVDKEWGTANNIKDENFSIAGKTGTAQTAYTTNSVEYISSFVGYFPAEKPKYSCIVVINKPNKNLGYYGAQVAAPVFKKIAKKIYSGIPKEIKISISNLNNYTNELFEVKDSLPNLIGHELMDAIVFLETNNIKVNIKGNRGKIKKQSVVSGTPLNEIKTIDLSL